MKQLLILLFILSISLFGSVGKVLAVKGDVEIFRTSGTILAKAGTLLEEKDKITSKALAKAQFKFNDGTIITLGSKSTLDVTEFSFNDKKKSANFKVDRGVFKTITGQIGKFNPDKFKISTRTTTIGIRGTIFLGEVTPEKESIACTQGAISVEANGAEVVVDAGEITSVLPGATPAAPRKLETRDLNRLEGATQEQKVQAISEKISDLSPEDKEAIAQVVENIKEIVDVNDRQGLVEELNLQLYDEFQEALWRDYNQIEADSSFQVEYTDSGSDYTSLVMGFHTNGTALSGSESDIEAATPKQAWFKQNGAATQYDTVITDNLSSEATMEGMFNTDSDGNSYAHWDGNDENRKVVEYSGKIMAVNTGTGDIDVSATNTVKMKFDFGNKMSYGYLNYGDGSYKIDLFKAESDAYSNSALYQYNSSSHMLNHSGATKKYSSAVMNLYFQGGDTNQLAGYFNLTGSDNSVNVGNVLLTKSAYSSDSSIKSYTLSKSQIGTDSNFEWGYWADTTYSGAALTTTSSSAELAAAKAQGGYVKANIAETTDAVMAELAASSNPTATYSGTIVGTVTNMTNGSYTAEAMKNGSVSYAMNFGTGTGSGTMGFSTVTDGAWNASVDKMKINGNEFSFGSSSVAGKTVGNAGTIISGEGSGKFYGTNAESIAGGTKITTYNSTSKEFKVAVGAIKADKQ